MFEKKFFVAGVQHHQLSSVLHEIDEEDGLELVPEPDNKFDPNAVRIKYNDVMIGYVPRKYSAEISALLDVGVTLGCIVTMLNKKAKPWEMIEVSITREDEMELDDDIEPKLNEDEDY